ncbi:MAG: TonB-dependent receptor [Flavobacteriia bacterium]|nr:TonB-dependent receptor [Flavobacteriia bacterium]
MNNLYKSLPIFHFKLILTFLLNYQIYFAQINDTLFLKNDSLKLIELNEIQIHSKSKEELNFPFLIDKKLLNLNKKNLSSFLSNYEAVESISEVHLITPSLGFKIFNTRGFNNTTNVRFSQLVDEIDNQAPHIGAPIANALGANDIDIDYIEIIPGSRSMVYGVNSTNGLINIKTKSPFIYQGISFQTINALNHLDNNSLFPPQWYNQNNLRIAQVFKKKWAIKLNFSNTKGKDWIANNTTDLAAEKNNSIGLIGQNNPALDEVNSYGNEKNNSKTLILDGKNVIVARTGYREKEIDNYDLQNYKGDFSFFYRPKNDSEISICYKGALLNTIYQRSNRFRLQNYKLNQFSIYFKSPFIQLKSYLTSENSGSSYNIRSLAENLDRAFKSDKQLFEDYFSAYNQAIVSGKDAIESHNFARTTSDNGRYLPNTESFDKKKQELIQINNWDIGAALKVKSFLFHSELSMNWNKIFKNLSKNFGLEINNSFDYRNYIIIPDGNYFINPIDSFKNINYEKFGGSIQMNKTIQKKATIVFILRANKASYFNWKLNPLLSFKYSLNNTTNFSLSLHSANRFPSIFEGYSNVNSGGVKRVGGLRIMSNGIFENSYTKKSIDLFQSQVNSDINLFGISQSESIEKNKNLLVKNEYTYIKPELVKTIEFGLNKTSKKYNFDFEFYYSIYNNFIAQVEVSVPKTEIFDSIPNYLYQNNTQEKYRMWTNSKSIINIYGFNSSVRYKFNRIFSASFNVTYSKLIKTENKDGLEDGFNTPNWILNSSLIIDNVWKNLDLSLNYKYQNAYEYISFLVNGIVPSFSTIDVQANYYFSKIKLNCKIGANNLLNKKYYSILGGPQIGGLYYLTLTYQI